MDREVIEKSSFYKFNDDEFQPGGKISLKHAISNKKLYIFPLTKFANEELKRMQKKSETKEQEIFKKLQELSRKWEEVAIETHLIKATLEYLSYPEVKHSNNEWVTLDSIQNETIEEISNRVYKMWIRFESYEPYNYQNNQNKYTVSWLVKLNAPRHQRVIATQTDKSFKDKEKALLYIAGRKKAYGHLFRNINPKLPNEYAEDFKIKDCLLPGYELEQQV